MKNKKLFIAVALAVVVVISCTAFFLTRGQSFDIRITVPAGNSGVFVYSDEQISPKGSKITLMAGAGLGDCEVVLKPVEVKEERAYDDVYITSGMPVKVEAEKGAWFRVGVNAPNPTEEDIDVYVTVKGIEVRIE